MNNQMRVVLADSYPLKVIHEGTNDECLDFMRPLSKYRLQMVELMYPSGCLSSWVL